MIQLLEGQKGRPGAQVENERAASFQHGGDIHLVLFIEIRQIHIYIYIYRGLPFGDFLSSGH